MLIAYDSRTGNVSRFVNKLGMKAIRIDENMQLDQPFVLITYTTGFGQVPEKVQAFLKKNYTYMKGIAASGNRNWGDGFAKSADTISRTYGVPIISKFELSGTMQDITRFREGVQSIAAY
ncbi:class Ib ribonucleoside-diphosphate reductase assembly flavoprotein NrdI [Marinicrinis lubricantis]|uniref:Protein NrdI n=1 Tax=Marinicrinis lubricantis TaxID=2086470 RepID=A0ABW1ITV6_9BACL